MASLNPVSSQPQFADNSNLRGAPDVFSYENSKNFASNVGVRGSTWLEGIIFHIQSIHKIRLGSADKTPQRLVSLIRDDAQFYNDYLSKLELVPSWNRETLRKEVEIISSTCPFIRKMYEMLVKTYVQCYFYNYPNLSFDITVPSLSVFLSAFYKSFACNTSVRSMDFFNLHGTQRDAIIIDSIRQALFIVTRDAMSAIFDKLNVQSAAPLSQIQQPVSLTPVSQHHLATAAPPSSRVSIPPTVDTLKTSHANAAFKNDVQQCVDYAETPMSKLGVVPPASIRSRNNGTAAANQSNLPNSNIPKSNGPNGNIPNSNEQPIGVAAEAAVLTANAVTPALVGTAAGDDVRTHRTIVMDTPHTAYSASDRHHRGSSSRDNGPYRNDNEPSRNDSGPSSRHRKRDNYDDDSNSDSNDSASDYSSDENSDGDSYRKRGPTDNNRYGRGGDDRYRSGRNDHNRYYGSKRGSDDRHGITNNGGGHRSNKHHGSNSGGNRSDAPRSYRN